MLIHDARGGPEAPITQHSRTMSSQEGTVHRLPESPPSVFTSQVAICVGLSLQSVLATRLLGGFLSNDESSSPMKETAVYCLELKLHCLPVSAKRQA